MTLTAEKEFEHIGETCGCTDHDRDLVHELSKRLDAVWRYDQYIANADGRPEVQAFWREQKATDMEAVGQLKELIRMEIDRDCF